MEFTAEGPAFRESMAVTGELPLVAVLYRHFRPHVSPSPLAAEALAEMFWRAEAALTHEFRQEDPALSRPVGVLKRLDDLHAVLDALNRSSAG